MALTCGEQLPSCRGSVKASRLKPDSGLYMIAQLMARKGELECEFVRVALSAQLIRARTGSEEEN